MIHMSGFRWLTPGLKLKRWLVVFGLGMLLVIIGVALMLNYQWLSYFEDLFLQFLYETTGSYNYTTLATGGFITILVGIVLMTIGTKQVGSAVVRAIIPADTDKVGDYIFQNIRMAKGLKVVVIGGGTGLSTLLRGLKTHTSNLTAIVTVADDGGSSGRLREDFQMIAPGDLRNCLVALAEKEGLMEQLFRYRFGGEGDLAGHSFGNLFLTALTQILDEDVDKALDASSKILKVRGRVIPASTQNIVLMAEMEDGSIVAGESQIPTVQKRIKRVFTEPALPQPQGAALQAIDEADAIILGPGSLYTSIMPNLLIDKIAEHIKASKAPKIYICNVMTQPGETDGYTAAAHVAALQRLAGQGIVDTAIVNDVPFDEAVIEKYKAVGAEPVKVDTDKLAGLGVRTVRAGLIQHPETAVHDPERLGKIVMDVIYAMQSGLEPHILEYYLKREDR